MKIIEKKCPNCSANLEYKVGERDVVCPSCRRAFAVEYDHDKFVDPEVQLKAKDIQLKMMDDFLKVRSFSKVFFVIVAVLMVAMIAFGVVMMVKSEKEMERRREESKAQQEEWNAQFQNDYDATREMIDNMRNEMEQ